PISPAPAMRAAVALNAAPPRIHGCNIKPCRATGNRNGGRGCALSVRPVAQLVKIVLAPAKRLARQGQTTRTAVAGFNNTPFMSTQHGCWRHNRPGGTIPIAQPAVLLLAPAIAVII